MAKIKTYDEDRLVQDLALRVEPVSKIAARHGLHRDYLGAILRGKSRKDLKARVDDLREVASLTLWQLVGTWLRPLLLKHAQEGLDEAVDPETARKCREFLMDRFAAPQEEAQRATGRPEARRGTAAARA